MAVAADDPVDFNHQVRPILSDRCFACHGPDAENRQAELRLDTPEGAFAALEYGEGSHVVKPGQPQQSEVYLRISSDDESMQMPPPESKLSLTAAEIATIGRWIEQGATWKRHWSFISLTPIEPPQAADDRWARNDVDRFVWARLQREGLTPSPQADRERLIRRVTYDLTGLPPTLDEIDAFLADTSPDAYEKVVDRLLASPRFGERMAVDWLDLARYADTYGYQSDVYRETWPWRDWVVSALNENLPYDQFITWQLAGDLLPDATQQQVLATAFNRLHRQTNEGGSIEQEFQTEYAADRTDTLGAAVLGLTLQCARCHEHKFDPISQQEYYRLLAFFNNIDECGLYSHFTNAVPTPTLLLTTDQQQQQIDDLAEQIDQAERRLDELAGQRDEAFRAWLDAPPTEPTMPGLLGHWPLEQIDGNKSPNVADATKPATLAEGPQSVAGRVGQGLRLSGENNVVLPLGNFTRNDPFSIALWINTPDVKQRAVVLHRSRSWTDAGSRGYQWLIEDGHLSASLIHFWPGNAIRIRTRAPLPVGQWVHVVMTYDGSSRADGLTLYLDGRAADCEMVRDGLVKNITGGGGDQLTLGQRFRDKGFKNGLVDELMVFSRALTPLEAAQTHDGASLAAALTVAADGRTDEQTAALRQYFLATVDAEHQRQTANLLQLRQQRSKLVDPIREIMVMREMDRRRPTYVLGRGAYDAPGEQVEPGTPASMLPFDPSWPRSRLGLARWLTDPRHPLTARVAVNRFWQSLFGRGLVATPEDFGSQGQLPSHPQLLDWLAHRFIASGWDVKATMRLIVTSATYRQDTIAPATLREADPDNVLLARGPAHRLSSEMIRDGALAAGGLLVEQLGGPPVKPYQPAGLWKEKSGKTYQRDAGAGSRRRSLYTMWKRTSPPPSMMIFDAAKRDVCVAQRQTTATPAQALVLLNDPQYVEAARALAERMLLHGGDSIEQRVGFAFRTLTGRHPDEKQSQVLAAMYRQQLDEFASGGSDAEKLLTIGDHRGAESLDRNELAAATVLVQALMSYDETVTKR